MVRALFKGWLITDPATHFAVAAVTTCGASIFPGGMAVVDRALSTLPPNANTCLISPCRLWCW